MKRSLLPVFFGALARRRTATLLSTLAIALGVALGLAVQLIHDAALDEFGRGMRVLAGSADLQISGPLSGFDDALFDRLFVSPQVAEASPVVALRTRMAGHGYEPVQILGVDVLRLAGVQPALLPRAADGQSRFAAFAPDAIFLSPGLLDALDLAAGDAIRLRVGTGEQTFRIAGVAPGLGRQRVALVDIAAAQTRLGFGNRLSRIDLRLREDANRDAAREALAAGLPAGVSVLAPQAALEQAGGLSRAYRVNLTMLAVIALMTGGFLVFSTQALSIARRHSEFAFLRAIGLGQRQLMAWVLTEGGLLGLVGGVLGTALGYGFAALAFRLLGGDLGAGYFEGVRPHLSFEAGMSLAFVALGVLAGCIGAWVPARAAARVAPAAALKAGGEGQLIEGRGHPRLALAALSVAALLCLLPPIFGLPLAGYLSIALLLAGGVLLLGRLAQALVRLLPARLPVALQLARARLDAAPGNAVVAGAGVLASAALAVAMAVMVASFRESVDDWLSRVLPAQVYVRVAQSGTTAHLDPPAQQALQAMPGVERVDFLRYERVVLDAARPRVTLIARPVSDDARELPLIAPARTVERPVWISEAVADLWQLAPGDTLSLPLAGRMEGFTVAGVWRDYARQTGALVLPLATYRTLTGDSLANDAAVHLKPGVDAAAFEAALHQRFAMPRLEARRPAEIRQISLRLFDRTFAVTYLLEAAAIAIGLAGVAASFGALAASRRREFGMLRHLGVSRRQIAAMIAAEGSLSAASGTLGGLLVGGGIALVLVEVVNRQSFHWSMDYRVPAVLLAVFALALVVLAALAAVLAGRQAMRQEAVRSVREDW